MAFTSTQTCASGTRPAEEAMNNWSLDVFPLLRGGVAAPIKQLQRYPRLGAAGEVKRLLKQEV
jgi:hypothetical protein